MLTSLLCRLMFQRWIWQHSNLCTTQHAHYDLKLFSTLPTLYADTFTGPQLERTLHMLNSARAARFNFYHIE